MTKKELFEQINTSLYDRTPKVELLRRKHHNTLTSIVELVVANDVNIEYHHVLEDTSKNRNVRSVSYDVNGAILSITDFDRSITEASYYEGEPVTNHQTGEIFRYYADEHQSIVNSNPSFYRKATVDELVILGNEDYVSPQLMVT